MITEAVVFTGPGEVTFREVECREPGPDDVVVKTRYSWISNGTEGSYLRGERSDGDTPFSEGDASPFPVVAGYQRVGIVEYVGERVQGLSVGAKVFATIGHVYGMHHDYGGQLRRSVSSADEVFVLPDDRNPIKYSGLVLAQVGWNAGTRPNVADGDFAVVVGDGLVGHWTAQTLLARGANVILVGRHDTRLAHFAGRPGASVVNAHGDDWPDAVRDITGTDGYRIGVDTVGSIDVMDTLVTTASRFAEIVSVGFYGQRDHLRLQPARYGEHTLHLVSGWTRDRLERTLKAVAVGELETMPLITHRFPARSAADAWRIIETKGEHVLGVVLDWED